MEDNDIKPILSTQIPQDFEPESLDHCSYVSFVIIPVNVFTFTNPSGAEQNNNGSFGLSPGRHPYLYGDGEAPSTVSLFDFSLKLAPSTIFVSNQRRRRAPIAPETTTLPSSSATASLDDKGVVPSCTVVPFSFPLFSSPHQVPLHYFREEPVTSQIALQLVVTLL
ncbi:hypothetical protein PIB30_025775 [Stylosanthes scabra]|uniref:Uncharacterized protein n=1 Tax=Stylosanthes scabra TaxID=79078 RepID=A0ABU6SA87_9FABA|nr:hypothetical protein [Stylosanthes scabra]